MGFNCGIVGLPNVGKSTIFNALASQHVPAENYPFCTKDHNAGVVLVPDKRLDDIAKIFKPQKLVQTHIEFVDIAGLVEGAHKGEGLGNKFLGHIRSVDAIAHVVRCFESDDVVHQYQTIDPVRDVDIVETEMILADLEVVSKQLEKHAKAAKAGDAKMRHIVELLEKLKGGLEKGSRLNEMPSEVTALKDEHVDLATTTDKPIFYIANVDEQNLTSSNAVVKALEGLCSKRNKLLVKISAAIESELCDLSPQEQEEFRDGLGLTHTSLEEIIKTGYSLLDLITFFTKESSEVKAWTVGRGTKAQKAAGRIHTDFEKGFVKAVVYNYDDLMKYKDEHALHEHGLVKVEGHDYVVRDGDIVQFRFTA